MKTMMMCAAAAAALTTFAGPAGAQPKPRFPIHRAPPTTQAAPAIAPAANAAPAAVEVQAEAPPVAAPVGAVVSTALPAIETAPAQPAAGPAEPARTEAPTAPVLTLASATIPPPAESIETSAPVYTMQSGDTLTGVTRRFKTTLAKLQALNDLSNASAVKAGQKIRLPTDATDTGAEPFAKGPAPKLSAVRLVAAPARPVLPRPTRQPPAATPKPVVTAAATTTTPAPIVTAMAPTTTPTLVKPAAPVIVAVPPPSPVAVSTPAPAPVVLASAPPAVRPPVRSLAPAVRAPLASAAVPAATVASASPAVAVAAAAAPTDPISAARGRFVWPVRGEVISPFGPKGPGQRNDGLNIAAQEGDPVRAAADGEVVYAGDQVPGFGKLVLIKHDGGWVTAYAHLSEIGVKMKDRVIQSREIGKAGRTGAVASPQLHFEVRYAPSAKDKARPVDPMPLLPQ